MHKLIFIAIAGLFFLSSCTNEPSHEKILSAYTWQSVFYDKISLAKGTSVDSVRKTDLPFLLSFTDSGYVAYHPTHVGAIAGKWVWSETQNALYYMNSAGEYWRFISIDSTTLITEELDISESGDSTLIRRHFQATPKLNTPEADMKALVLAFTGNTWRAVFQDNSCFLFRFDTGFTAIGDNLSKTQIGYGEVNKISNTKPFSSHLKSMISIFEGRIFFRAIPMDMKEGDDFICQLTGKTGDTIIAQQWTQGKSNSVAIKLFKLDHSLNKIQQKQFMAVLAGVYKGPGLEVWMNPYGYFSVNNGRMGNYDISLDGRYAILQDSIVLHTDTFKKTLYDHQTDHTYSWSSRYLKE